MSVGFTLLFTFRRVMELEKLLKFSLFGPSHFPVENTETPGVW